MGIFVGAALAGFLLFGWINASPKKDDPAQKSWVRDFFLIPCVQGWLGSLALVALVLVLIVLMFPSVGRLWSEDWWSEYWAVRIALDLTGTEVAQLILGAVFGCILRYWGPQFWVVRMPPGTRYNWVAISLAGLLLLAAAIPYMERQFGSMTGLKTPFAEFQFAGKRKAELPVFEKGVQIVSLSKPQTLEQLDPSFIQVDLDYLELFSNGKSAKHNGTYEKSQNFAKNILEPLGKCALEAYENHLDTESIRHALIPVVTKLRLLIQQGQSIPALQSQGPDRSENQDNMKKNIFQLLLHTEFMSRVTESKKLLKKALVTDEGKTKCKLSDEEDSAESQKPEKLPIASHIKKTLADAPHIYLALAYLDQFNDNRRGAISILEEALDKFSDDHSPGILFNINYSLFLFLREEDNRDRKSILPFLDRALEIAQETGRRIDELKEANSNPDIFKPLKKYFEILKILTKNTVAYVSAEEGIRKFEALQYANHNYRHRDKLPMNYWPPIIDTYGYVKMAFESRKNYPNFDEIQEARALFIEARSHAEGLPDLEEKSLVMKGLRAHLEQANMLLKNQ